MARGKRNRRQRGDPCSLAAEADAAEAGKRLSAGADDPLLVAADAVVAESGDGAPVGGGGGAACGDESDDGWAVVGRSGRTLAEASVRRAAVAPAAGEVAQPPSTLALPAAASGGPGDGWEALGMGKRPILSVAPMMAWTDVHYRSLARLLTRRTLLYTEMLPAPTVLEAAAEGPAALSELLAFPASQRPVAVQLGGCDPKEMGAAAALCVAAGYDEVGINVGCPSPIVASHNFGVVLMKDPQRTAEIARAVVAACSEVGGTAGSAARLAVPVSVKHRLGVDDHDSYAELEEFVRAVAEGSGVTQFVVHARKAWLRELSPALNLEVPPLRYDWVSRLCQRFPQLRFELNGGVKTLEIAEQHCGPDAAEGRGLSGAMIGRAAYNSSWATLATADTRLFGEPADPAESRRQVIGQFLEYAESVLRLARARGPTADLQRALCRPLLGLVSADESEAWRETLLQALEDTGESFDLLGAIARSLAVVPAAVLDSPPASVVN